MFVNRITGKVIVLFMILCLMFPIVSFGASEEFVWSSDEVTSSVNANASSDGSPLLNLECGGAVLIEQNSGKVLYDHHMHEKLKPASVTKVMTILLIMEALDSGKITLDTKIPCSENARSMGGSQIWLDTREMLTVNEMLKAICVVSANDCTVAMAEYLAGSEEGFVLQMNQKAQALGMKDTTFKNCHGIDEDGHETSAYDISLMSRELLLNHPSITNYTTIWMDSLRDGKSQLVNTNKLIRNYKGATGLKTGSTSVALYNLSASATRDDLSLIAVVMKAPTTKIRFAEAQKLLDYGFSMYSYREFGKKADVVKSVSVTKGTLKTVNAILENSTGAFVKKGEEKNLVQNVNLGDAVQAPITRGQTLGEVTYSLNGEVVGRSNIVSEKDIPQISLWSMMGFLFETWYQLIR